jgi:hypothetical protein
MFDSLKEIRCNFFIGVAHPYREDVSQSIGGD